MNWGDDFLKQLKDTQEPTYWVEYFKKLVIKKTKSKEITWAKKDLDVFVPGYISFFKNLELHVWDEDNLRITYNDYSVTIRVHLIESIIKEILKKDFIKEIEKTINEG